MKFQSILNVFLMLLIACAGAAQAAHGTIETTVIDGSVVEYEVPLALTQELSADGKTMISGSSPMVLIANPNLPKSAVRIPAPMRAMAALAAPEQATSNTTFSITYLAAGEQDLWGADCYTFPEEAKTVFDTAALIWSSILDSDVPITIRACWGEFEGSTLGYSGGQPLHNNFPGATQPDTSYAASLANSLAGEDLRPDQFDMHITYNGKFIWYYGTDGSTPSDRVDLLSVVLHEVAHGLNFAGTMQYSNGIGNWGYTSGLPNIYDTLVQDGSGNSVIDTSVYANSSTELGRALTSNNLWFHGSHAMAANGGERVRIYAPSQWKVGSSYAHLDDETFGDTENRMMVSSIGYGTSIHDPGPVTIGMLTDMGWQLVDSVQEDQPLSNGQTLSNLSGTAESEVYYYIDVPSGMTSLTVEIWGGAGDADLYLRLGSAPTTTDYDCRPYKEGNEEECNLTSPAPGRYYIMLRGYSAYSEVSLRAEYLGASVPSVPTATAASNISNLGFTANWQAVSGASGYRLDVASNSTFTSFVSGYQDLDIGNSTTRSVSGLNPGTPYYYRVRAYNRAGISANSNVVTATTTSTGAQELDNGQELSGLFGVAGSETTYYIDVPSGTSRLKVSIWNGMGDADLYVSLGGTPTVNDYDCRPYLDGNEEECTFESPTPGRYYIMVRGYGVYQDLSLRADYISQSSDPIPLTSGQLLTDLEGELYSERYYYIDVPSGATSLSVETWGGLGDADLYVQFDGLPTEDDWDCRPYDYGNDEECSIPNPKVGRYYIMVRGYDSYSGLSLSATSSDGTSDVQPLTNNQTLTNLSGQADSTQYYYIDVPAGSTSLIVRTSGGVGDVDLYLRLGSYPTLADYDCSPYEDGNEEECVIASPTGGRYFIMLHGFDSVEGYSGVSLTASYLSAIPEIDVEGDGVAIADGDVSPSTTDMTDFGNGILGFGGVIHLFTIHNSGTTALNLNGTPRVEISGVDSADFNVTLQPTSPVPAGGSTMFLIKFVPSAKGLRQATVHIANNDSDENPYDFAIQGTGTSPFAPEIELFGSTDFGTTDIGGEGVLHRIRIENTGTATLQLNGSPPVTLTGPQTSDFAIELQPTTPVQPGTSTYFDIRFTPTTAGAREATVNIPNNDDDDNPFTFLVSGTGGSTAARILRLEGDLTFGQVMIGQTAARTLRLHNDGTATLTVNAISYPTGFSGAWSGSIAAGAAQDVTVTFAPTASQSYGGTLTVDSDKTSGTSTATLSGAGSTVAGPEISVEGNGVSIANGDTTPSAADYTDYGELDIDTSSRYHTFTIRNLGTADLHLSGSPPAVLSGPQSADFAVVTQPGTLVPAGGSTSLFLKFDPSATGLRQATLSLANDDSDENPFTFALQGTGIGGGSSTEQCVSGTLPVTGPALAGVATFRSETLVRTVGDIVVSTGADVLFEAAGSIELNPGFSVQSGARFLARIGAVDCLAYQSIQEPVEQPAATTLAAPAPAPVPLSRDALPASLLTRLAQLDLDVKVLDELSAAGELIVFSSPAPLVAEDTNAQRDIYAYDGETERLWLVSRAADGAPGNAPSDQPRIDGWGEYIVYRSLADNLGWQADTNGVADIYLHSLLDGRSERVSWGESGEEASGAAANPDLGGEQLRIVFDRGEAEEAARGIYLYAPEAGAYSERRDPGDCGAHHPVISADGAYLAYLCGDPAEVESCEVRFQHLASDRRASTACPAGIEEDYRLFFGAEATGVQWLPASNHGGAWTANPLLMRE